MMPDKAMLEEARDFMAIALKPAGSDGVIDALQSLFYVLEIPNVASMSPEQKLAYFQERAAEYQRLLAHVPADLLKAAADAHVLKSKFFPAISELVELAGPELEKRKRQAERVGYMIEAHGKPRPQPREKTWAELTPEEQRAKSIAKLRDGIPVLRKHNRIATAITWEHELAALEGRDVEEWAKLTGNTADTIIVDEPELKGTLPRDGRKWESASSAAAPTVRQAGEAQSWKAGEPLYAPPEPPPPDAIAENVAGEGEEIEP